MKLAQYLIESTCEIISQAELKQLEKFADALLKEFDIDVDFTKHFGERMSDKRNRPCITTGELQKFFGKIKAMGGKKIKSHGKGEAVLKDLTRLLNIPVVIKKDRKGEIDLVLKTIMRKKNFKTPNKVIQYR